MKRFFTALAAVGCLTIPALAQNVVSARAGLINYTEGDVTLRDEPVRLTAKRTYVEMKDNDVVRTTDGRAEVLLSPGVILRLAENSSVRLVSGSLTDTHVELVSGDAIIEVSEIYEGSRLRVALGGREANVAKVGLYRFNTDPDQIRVYDGRIEVPTDNPDKPTVAKKGAVVSMSNGLVARKFDTDEGDTFYRWASRRSGYIAMANVSSANTLRSGGYNSGFYGSGIGTGMRSGWFFNPYLGMFTYIPFAGTMYSPFGYRYYTPRTVYVVTAPRPSAPMGPPAGFGGGFDRTPTYNPSYGYNTVGARSVGGGMSSGGVSAGPSSAPAAAPAGDGGGSRGGGGMGGGRGASGAGGRAQ